MSDKWKKQPPPTPAKGEAISTDTMRYMQRRMNLEMSLAAEKSALAIKPYFGAYGPLNGNL